MNEHTHTQLPDWLQALSDRIEVRRRISEKQRELPYDKWAQYDNKIAELEAQKAFDQAYRTWEATGSLMPGPKQRAVPNKDNWYTDQNGHLIVRRQRRRKPATRAI